MKSNKIDVIVKLGLADSTPLIEAADSGEQENESADAVGSSFYTQSGTGAELMMEQVKAVAAAGEKMPQKSTFFYPKMFAGLVINKL